MVRGIVSGLEQRFEGVDEKMATTPSAGTEWKGLALAATLSEIPRIPIAGTETGISTGFGDKIYAKSAEIDVSQTVRSRIVNICCLHFSDVKFLLLLFAAPKELRQQRWQVEKPG
jgi:hypothetical protein